MLCPQCGFKIDDDANFCSNCGAPIVRQASDEVSEACHDADAAASEDSDVLSVAGKIAADGIAAVGNQAMSVASNAADAASGALSFASRSLKNVLGGRKQEVADEMDKQDDEAIDYAVRFLKELIRLRGVSIDREHFLTTELEKKGASKEQIGLAVEKRPAEAGISREILDKIAAESISFETNKSSAMSFAAGLPGGFAMLGTIPADITQYYVHAFRIMQKLAYLYGWSSFLDDCKEVDDETLALLGSFFGVMLGVAGATKALSYFAVKTVMPSVEKRVAAIALTKTVWYGPLKNALRFIGVSITKQSVGKAASKVVPVIGGVISGGMTFVSLSVESKRLREHLVTLPPTKSDDEIVIDESAFVEQLEIADAEETNINV